MFLEVKNVGIIQALANIDPDVDAIYRLLLPIPFNFSKRMYHNEVVSLLRIPKKAYSPYNAQATLHFYAALWSLWLPVTVHGRVSDIWRGYIYQKIAKDIGLELLFSSPVVTQIRNVHNYLADFDSEQDLYRKSEKLIEELVALKLKSTSLPGRMEELYVFLYERDYIKLADVQLCQDWLTALDAVGYVFPSVTSTN